MNKFFDKLRNIKAKSVAYPAIVLLFTLAVVAIFFYSVQFLSNNLNRIFVIEDTSANSAFTTIDLVSYSAVAKKLGFGNASEAAPAASPLPAPAAASSMKR